MSADCETLIDDPKIDYQSDQHDFPNMGVDLIKRVNFKVAFFLLLLGAFLFSDIFVEQLLPSIYKDGDSPTTAGTTMQLIIFVLMYIVIDLLVQGDIL